MKTEIKKLQGVSFDFINTTDEGTGALKVTWMVYKSP